MYIDIYTYIYTYITREMRYTPGKHSKKTTEIIRHLTVSYETISSKVDLSFDLVIYSNGTISNESDP